MAAALAAGWTGAALLIAVILVPTLAVCWIVADAKRPGRLAMLLTAWRHGTPPPLRQPAPRNQLPRRGS